MKNKKGAERFLQTLHEKKEEEKTLLNFARRERRIKDFFFSKNVA